MKSVLISIRPKWCEKIASGEKTIEVRKTSPKLETPFKCYIYRTKGTVPHIINGKWVQMEVGGTVIGEFVCDCVTPLYNVCTDDWKRLTGGLHRIEKELVNQACLTEAQLHTYAGGKNCFAWHISNLKIYDTPKELSKFPRPFENCIDKVCDEFGCASCENGGYIKRPPQSWCYVEELK